MHLMQAGKADTSPISRDRRTRLAAYLGVLAAFLAATPDDPLTPWNLAFFGTAALWSLGAEHRFRRAFFSPALKIALIAAAAVAFILFIAISGASASEPRVGAITRFLFWNTLVFILSRNKSEYDLWTLAIIELSLFMVSAAFAQPPAFAPLLLFSTACMLYAFQRAAILKCGPAGQAEKGGAGLVLTSFLLVVEIAAISFFAFPRAAFRQTNKPPTVLPRGAALPEGLPVASEVERTGIPRNPAFLNLMHFDKLKIDTREVLRLRVTDGAGAPLHPDQTPYLRGAILETYERGAWRSKFSREMRRDGDDGTQDGWTRLDPPAEARPVARQIVRTTALAGDLAFAIPDPARVQLPQARYDPAGVIFFDAPPRGTVEYAVESAIMPVDLPRAGGIPKSPERWLQVPPELTRLREMADRLMRGVGPSLHARVAKLQGHLLRNGFGYTLAPFVPAPGVDPVEHFLFVTRQGCCSHYATALALLCRASGVPARVATGFQLHDPDPDGTFRVRSSDAHAWVEIWFGPMHGWRAYDATPDEGRAAATPSEGDAVASVEKKKALEAAPPSRWDRFITEYDPGAQNEAIGAALKWVRGAIGKSARVLLSPPTLLTAASALLLATLTWLCMPRRQRRRLRRIVSGFRAPTTVDFYGDFLWALSRRGIRKNPAQTAREFARDARALTGDDGIDFVTDKFYEARYRQTPPAPDERRRIDEIVTRILKPAR